MQLKFRKTGNFLVVTPEGDLDHHSASEVREQIDNKLQSTKAKNLIFNLNKLQFMDSSGLGVLIGRYKAVSLLGGETIIISPSPATKRLIVLSGIHKIIPIYQTLSEALGGVK